MPILDGNMSQQEFTSRRRRLLAVHAKLKMRRGLVAQSREMVARLREAQGISNMDDDMLFDLFDAVDLLIEAEVPSHLKGE